MHFCEILDHEGSEITVDQLVEKYNSLENKGSNYDQENESKQTSFDETKYENDETKRESDETKHNNDRRKPESEKNDQRPPFSCNYCRL